MFDAFTKVDCDAKVLSFTFWYIHFYPNLPQLMAFSTLRLCHMVAMHYGLLSSFSGDMSVIQHTVARNPGCTANRFAGTFKGIVSLEYLAVIE